MESLAGKIAAAALSLLALGGMGTMIYEASQSNAATAALVASATQNAAKAAQQ
ncbi:MAG: hypothetical protein KGL42_12525 [Betaproteobacteria bacterium]|jgi:hypothetical protein|nr:hypothetical protein [Betaproteobacteria bacterium]